MTPRLSVVVPFFNVERYISGCLDSLARQTFTDFEVILVDDGSRDASAEVAREFCSRDRRFRLVTQDNAGLGPARNTGVRHAQGDHLAFVDSDDLVPRHAYEILLRSLAETCSSIAAGNARRFNNTAGVRQSYVHRLPFAADRPATHVFDHPPLAVDRMVWNKVFQRRFWDQFGYEFPAIRYEDYPVTLRAHLDAITVDCVAAPVYYWRERESGESITQLRFQYANLADRVVSAEMVLDLLDRRAPELRPEVHRHLAAIDLLTLAQAFATAGDDELAALVALGRRLSGRLDPGALAGVPTFQRLEYEALQAGDADLLRRLARYRALGDPRGVRARRHPALPWRFESLYPGLRDGSRLPAGHYRLPRNELELRATTTSLDWSGDALVLRGRAEVTHLPVTADATLTAALVCGNRRYPLHVELTPPGDGARRLGFETRVPRTLLAALPGYARSAHVAMEMRTAGVRRRGALGPGILQYPWGERVGRRWFQPVRTADRRLTLLVRGEVAELVTAEVDGDDLVLAGRIPARMADPALRLERPCGDVRVPLSRRRGAASDEFTARLPLDELIDAVNPDDPFLERTVLVPRVDDGDDQMLMVVTGLERGVLAKRGGRVVCVGRSPAQYLNLVEGPARVTADRFEAAGGRLTVSGPCWPGVAYEGIAWRRFVPGTDDAVDAPCRVTLDGRRWSAESDLPGTGAGGPQWTLFAVPPRATPYAVQADTFLLSRLPRRVGRFVLCPGSGTLRLETD